MQIFYYVILMMHSATRLDAINHSFYVLCHNAIQNPNNRTTFFNLNMNHHKFLYCCEFRCKHLKFLFCQKNASIFHTKLTSHYVKFNPTQPAWSHFDITTCIRQSNQMFLKVTLDGKLYLILMIKYEYC